MSSPYSRYLYTFALPLALLGGGAYWMVGRGVASRGPALTYDTAETKRGAIRKLVSTSGPVRALVTVSVGSQLSGQVHELKVDFNSEVKENEILAILDDKTYEAKLAQARADLAMARAALTNQEATLKKSEAVLKAAERTSGRQQTLAQKGIAATATVDNATRDSEIAKADIAVSRAQIENAKAQIEQRTAQMKQAEIDHDRTRIRSPINGTVISRTIDVGQTVAASLQAPELFKIAQDLRRIRIEAQVNEADVGAVADGNAVEFTVDAYPERKFTGKVTQVRLAATELQNVVTYTVIIEAENADRKLFPGMTANVRIETARRDNVLSIPNDATRFRPRNRTAAAPSETASAGGEGDGARKGGGQANRTAQMLEQLKDALKLDAIQTEAVQTGMREVFKELRAQREAAKQSAQGPAPGFGGGGAPTQGGDMAGNRARIAERLDQILQPILTAEQRPLYDVYRRGRDQSRTASVWVLNANGDIESRGVRLGIADETMTEVLGGQLKDGDKVVVRARELKK